MSYDDAAATETVSWVRKRSNELVPFSLARLRETIARAAADAMVPLDDEAADELARMLAFVAARSSTDGIIDAAELEERVITGLEQTGHEAIARAYQRFALERRAFRDRVQLVLEQSSLFASWTKPEIRRWLQSKLDLSEDQAAMVARSLERALVGARIDTVTEELIVATINALLRRIGCPDRLPVPGWVCVDAQSLSLDRVPGRSPEVAAWQVSAEVWREYALAEVFTPDIVAAQRTGGVTIEGPWMPLQLAGVATNAAKLAERARSPAEGVHGLIGQLAQLWPYCGRLLAFDLLDVALALLCPNVDRLFECVEAFCSELWAIAHHSPVPILLNLYGRMPARARTSATAGPLFQEQPPQHLHERVDAAAAFLLDRLRENRDPAIPVVIDYHWSPQDAGSLTRSAASALSLAVRDGSVRIAFDRYTVPLGDGLAAKGAKCSLIQVNLDLAEICTDVGEHELDAALSHAVELAVRAGLQRREWVRRESLPDFLHQRLQSAALLICPVGLDAACQCLTGYGIGEHPSAAALAVRIVRGLQSRAEALGRAYGLTVRIDRTSPSLPYTGSLPNKPSLAWLPGLTCWAPDRGMREQIHRTGLIHREVGMGTLLMPLRTPPPWPIEHLVDVLNWAWESSLIVRLQFVPVEAEGLLQGEAAGD